LRWEIVDYKFIIKILILANFLEIEINSIDKFKFLIFLKNINIMEL